MTQIKTFLLFIYTFLLIYYPPILPINMLHFVGSIALLLLLFESINNKKIYGVAGFFKFAGFILIILIYLSVVMLVNTSIDVFNYYPLITLLIEILPASILITNISIKRDVDFYKLIIFVGLFQATLSILMFLIQPLQNLYLQQLINYGYSDIYTSISNYRVFGVSYSLPYGMPIVQSIISIFALYYGVNKEKKYLIIFLVLAFSAIINARTPIILIGIGIIIVVIDVIIRRKAMVLVKLIPIIGLGVLALIAIIDIINLVSPITYFWINSGINQITTFLSNGNNTEGYFAYIFNANVYILPDHLGLLFGKGIRIIRGSQEYQSDIGFINDIWLGGLIYSVLVYSFIIYGFSVITKNIINKRTRFLVFWTLIILFIAINFKGTMFKVNEITIFFSLCFIYYYSRFSKIYQKSILN